MTERERARQRIAAEWLRRWRLCSRRGGSLKRAITSLPQHGRLACTASGQGCAQDARIVLIAYLGNCGFIKAATL